MRSVLPGSFSLNKEAKLRPAPGPECAGPGQPRTVLLIDDDSSVRHSIRRVLHAERLEVIASPGGQHAARHIFQPEIALVITDLRMAPIDGWDFLFHCRIGRPQLPVFVVSGVPLQACGGADRLATKYFQKPVDLETLLKAIRAQLHLPPLHEYPR